MENKKPYFLELSRLERKRAVEAMIFASEEPLSIGAIYGVLILRDFSQFDASKLSSKAASDEKQLSIEKEIKDKYGISASYIEELIEEINADLLESGRPYEIVNYAGGYQFATRSEYGKLVGVLLRSRSRKKLSQASLETLAIIAYKQPITKPEIEKIRGVNSGEIVNSLIEKNLVRIAGRRDSLGKPLTYATTEDFMKMFGLTSLEDLPKLRELEEFGDGDGEESGENIVDLSGFEENNKLESFSPKNTENKLPDSNI